MIASFKLVCCKINVLFPFRCVWVQLLFSMDVSAAACRLPVMSCVYHGGLSVSSPGRSFGEMSEVAPDDIQSDTERVHETLQSQLDGIGDGAGDALSGDFGGMLGTLASGFMDSVVNAGSFRRMDQFIVDNCGGEHMFAASPQR